MCPDVTSTGRLTALELYSREEDIPDAGDYEMQKQQICPDENHLKRFKRLSVDQFLQLCCVLQNYRIKNSKHCLSEVQSISLKLDKPVDLNLINNIIWHCPKLSCLSIKSQRFNFGAWNRLLDRIIPSVLHLSIDDKIEINGYKKLFEKHWSLQLIQQSKQLEDLKVELNANSDFDVDCFEYLQSIIYIHISDLAPDETTLEIEKKSKMMEKATRAIIRGKGRNLEYFRIGNRDKIYLTPSLLNIAKMTSLRGLNLSVINCEKCLEELQPCPIDYKRIAHLNLETLTDLEAESECVDTMSTEFFHSLRRAKCRTTLNRRRLQHYELNVRKFDLLVSNFKHLEILQLIDCVVVDKDIEDNEDKDMDEIIESLTRLPSLREIVVEYNEMSVTDCLSIGFQQIEELITRCRRLDNLTVKLSEDLSEEQKSYLRNIKRSVNIDFE